MTLLEILKENKGTVSSALSKQLAKDVLAGNMNILKEAAELIHYDSKVVRSGAAKIIEKVAEEKPELVAPLLPDLLTTFDYEEPQTKWMMIHTFGLCAKLKPEISREIFDTVLNYWKPDNGTCLRDRSITYLGYIGSVSKSDCDKSFPWLIDSFKKHPDRVTRVFESMTRMINWMDDKQKKVLSQFIEEFSDSKSPEIKKWTKRVSKKLNE